MPRAKDVSARRTPSLSDKSAASSGSQLQSATRSLTLSPPNHLRSRTCTRTRRPCSSISSATPSSITKEPCVNAFRRLLSSPSSLYSLQKSQRTLRSAGAVFKSVSAVEYATITEPRPILARGPGG